MPDDSLPQQSEFNTGEFNQELFGPTDVNPVLVYTQQNPIFVPIDYEI